MNRYGLVSKYYSSLRISDIESDIEELIKEKFDADIYDKILNPPNENPMHVID